MARVRPAGAGLGRHRRGHRCLWAAICAETPGRGATRAEALAREARKLRRLLWINTGLDVLYVTGGFVLLYTSGAQNPFAAGNGWGVIVQGGFLFVFDLLHAVAVPRKGG